MKLLPFLFAAVVGSLAVASATAGEVRVNPKAVVELFTSQGCSSCPEADAKFAELDARPDLIALAWHVDYWDYIGWSDTFGTEANSDRQRAYAESWGSSRIYTPQLIVNGLKGVVGSRDSEVEGALAEAKLALPIGVEIKGDMLKVSVSAQPGTGPAMVWLVTYRDRASVTIERGENAGQTIEYRQIVTGKQMLGAWEGSERTVLKLPLSELSANGSNGAVILVQTDKDGLPGSILGAAQVEL
ncbi:MAG TPA: DUF1223 domain-containing protein [Devosia sp.]|jgi:hypothetical protein|nr:DUF1223 domain-containing protein [Devosia sp.]